MIRNSLKKKKGFTLVEVIIVLAIIAIIAAIAIPNLTKVRTESKIKADTQSAETIRKTVITLITDDTLKTNGVEGTITFTDKEGAVTTGANTGKLTGMTIAGATVAPGKDLKSDVFTYFEGIKMPQADGATGYTATIKTDGNVEVKVDGTTIEVK